MLAPFLGVLLALTVIDLRTLRLPDAIMLPTAGVAAVAIAVADLLGGEPSILGGLTGAIAFGGGMWTVYGLANLAYRRKGQRAMGFGDVKLAALIGLVVGSIDLGSVAVSAGATPVESVESASKFTGTSSTFARGRNPSQRMSAQSSRAPPA